MTRFSTATRLITMVLAALLLATMSALMLSASGAHADEGMDSISGAPGKDGARDTGRSRFTYQIDPGQTIQDFFYVENTGSTEQALTVFPTDAFNDAEGNFSMLSTDEEPSGVGAWVTFEDGTRVLSLTLAPGESRSLPFTMRVPDDARPGDHVGGMLVSATTPGDQVALERRVAARLYARVSGDLQAAMSITSLAASYDPSWNPFSGTMTITYTVTNSGNVSLLPTTVARVKGILGIPLSENVRDEHTEMLPGEVRTMTATLEGVGQWVYANPTVSLATSIDDDARNPGVLPSTERDTVVFVVPWALLALLLLVGGVWLFVRWRRRVNDVRAREWAEYIEAEALKKAGGAAAAQAPAADPHASREHEPSGAR